ncbi:glycosyltransferase [Thiorhodococcus fuscus]|uniref:Glycosyltransferase n=1 Tax=Thiorhodococcus fuscus TaxID=527200 RepID=A0ABW4Y6K8_9GAMM
MSRKTAVIMACHNRKATTLECLKRLFEQEWKPEILDVYLVDDASTDGTASAVRSTFSHVRIIEGDGMQFWCGGMRLAWAAAAKGDYDFYLWLNDDTWLLPSALKHAFDLHASLEGHSNEACYIVGSIRDPLSLRPSYGGMSWTRDGWRMRSELLTPEGFPKRCDTLNGNFALIPRAVFQKVGNLSTAFTHGMGDFDYGLRARAAGCQLWATGEYVAECQLNTTEPAWLDSTHSLADRWKSLNSPKGTPPLEYLRFVSKHGGPLWPLTLAKLFGRFLLPGLWSRIKATKTIGLANRPSNELASKEQAEPFSLATPSRQAPTGSSAARRLRILVSAYACDPDIGSEAGMGWNWIRHLALHADLWVLTEENRSVPALKKGIARHPELQGRIQIIGIPRHRYGERLWSHFYYLSYRDWQWAAYRKAVDLHREIGFDLAHQLNMIGYREPGYLWKLPIPFVWGPVGGHAQMPWRYIPSLDRHSAIHYSVRNVLNAIQMRTSGRVRKAVRAADVILAATREDQTALRRTHGLESVLLNEQGTTSQLTTARPSRSTQTPLKLVWCGLFVGRKALPLGLKAMQRALAAGANIQLDIVGSGMTETTWKELAQHLGIASHCRWHGMVEHAKALDIMADSDALLFTSLQEGTPAVILEALQSGLPIVCHDACGFGTTVNDECALTVPLRNPEISIAGFTAAILRLAHEPGLVERLSAGAIARAAELSWQSRALLMMEHYQYALHIAR